MSSFNIARSSQELYREQRNKWGRGRLWVSLSASFQSVRARETPSRYEKLFHALCKYPPPPLTSICYMVRASIYNKEYKKVPKFLQRIGMQFDNVLQYNMRVPLKLSLACSLDVTLRKRQRESCTKKKNAGLGQDGVCSIPMTFVSIRALKIFPAHGLNTSNLVSHPFCT